MCVCVCERGGEQSQIPARRLGPPRPLIRPWPAGREGRVGVLGGPWQQTGFSVAAFAKDDISLLLMARCVCVWRV